MQDPQTQVFWHKSVPDEADSSGDFSALQEMREKSRAFYDTKKYDFIWRIAVGASWRENKWNASESALWLYCDERASNKTFHVPEGWDPNIQIHVFLVEQEHDPDHAY